MQTIINRSISIILIITALFSLYSCEEFWNTMEEADQEDESYCDTYDYADCDTQEPFWADLIINLTINEENQRVPIAVYREKFDNNSLVVRDTADAETWEIPVELNQEYSVTATYKSGEKTIIAVDADEIKKSSSDVCDSTCWEIKGGYIDVELRYSK